MEKTEARWVEVFKVSLPLCLSYVPIGLACGILLHAAGFNPLLTLLVSVLVFSGGAQFLIASMLTTNTPMQTIVIMLFFLELRYALLGSSLSQYIKGTSKKFLYFFAVSLNMKIPFSHFSSASVKLRPSVILMFINLRKLYATG